MQNKLEMKLIYKQNNISISNGMSIAVKSHCAHCETIARLCPANQYSKFKSLMQQSQCCLVLRKLAFSSTCSYDFGVQQKAYHKSKTLFRHYACDAGHAIRSSA